MAESEYAGDYPSMCSVVPMILSEGTITVTARAYSSRGLYETVATFASELRKGDPVALALSESVTYDNTLGLGAVTRISAGRPMKGRIVSEPRWVSTPPTSTGTYPLFSSNITNKYYRIADVELWGVSKVHACKHTTTNANAFLIGSCGRVAISAASSYSSHKICIEDITGVGRAADLVHLTYRAAGSAGTAYTQLIASPSGINLAVNT